MALVNEIFLVLKHWDNTAAIINAEDTDRAAHTKQQLPTNLQDLKDEYMHLDYKSTFWSNIAEERTRTFRRIIKIGSSWTSERLIDKTKLAMDKIGVNLAYKAIQRLRTQKDLLIMGTQNSIW